MRNKLTLLAILLVAASFSTGCMRTEKKFGRGLANSMEIVRLGEFRRTVEQTTLTQGPDAGMTTGFVRGLNRSLARTGLGLYEMVTAPFPPFEPQFTDYLAPGPVYPDNYKPSAMSDSLFATDSNLGFSGGDVLPMVPGSRFRIFDTY